MSIRPARHLAGDMTQQRQPSCSQAQIAALARHALELSGIRLSDRNDGFFQRRLPALLEESGYGSPALYIAALATEERLRRDFVEALTVHTTSFFREERQYHWLADQGLPALARDRSTIALWSAAASTGEEGWSALMVADRTRSKAAHPFRARLIGTDISRKVVARARRAIYRDEELNGLSRETRHRYFMTSRTGDGRVRIVPELRALADWREGNLATGDGLSGMQADIAFLRNVLIYFPETVQARVIDRVVARIRPGGYLLTGHSETGFAHPDLTVVEPSIYRKGG